MTEPHAGHDANVEAFGVCPRCDTLLGIPSSAALGEAAADEAIGRAGAAAPPDWTATARATLREVAAGGGEFTTDELWERLPAPPEPRAMGAVIRWGQQQGLISDTGRSRPSVRTECHGRPVSIWVGRR